MSMVDDTTASPLVLELGKLKRKAIKRLRKGRGGIATELQAEVEAAVAAMPELEGKSVVPVVILYERKRRFNPWRW